MPPVFEGTKADTIEELAKKLNLDPAVFCKTVEDYNNACVAGEFNHTVLDNCHTENITPQKTHWAVPLNQPPYYAYALQ